MIIYPTFTTENFPESVDFRKSIIQIFQKTKWSNYKFSNEKTKTKICRKRVASSIVVARRYPLP